MAAERSGASPESERSGVARGGAARSCAARLRRGVRGPVATTVAFAAAGGFVLSAALLTGREAAEVRHSRHDELVALVEARHEHVEALEAELDELRRELDGVEQAANPAGGLRREVRHAERAAGLSALAGPGVRLRLEDAQSECPTGDPADCRIRDRDLQAAVNTLFAAGAEAIAVNGQRVVATTAIRNAGSAVLVNYHVLGPPYDVAAIGEPERLAAGVRESDLAHDFEVWTERYGLGFDMETVDELTLPAYGGSLRTREAEILAGEKTRREPDGQSPSARDPGQAGPSEDGGRGLTSPDTPAARGEEAQS